MKLSQIAQWFIDNELNKDTISLYSCDDVDDGDIEAYLGVCDITGKMGIVVPCQCLTTEGELYAFEALESLVGGSLGKLAGAF